MPQLLKQSRLNCMRVCNFTELQAIKLFDARKMPRILLYYLDPSCFCHEIFRSTWGIRPIRVLYLERSYLESQCTYATRINSIYSTKRSTIEDSDEDLKNLRIRWVSKIQEREEVAENQ